jgi:hypothetical protein
MVVCAKNKCKYREFSVQIEGSSVYAAKEIELLGMKISSDLSMTNHAKAVAATARQRAGMVQRLTHYVPRGPYLRQLAMGLVLGAVCYAVAVVTAPRLDQAAAPSMGARATQVALNDVARSLTGCKRKQHMKIGDLLMKANFPSYNELATRALAMETWCAYTSKDGPGGSRNPLGSLMFDLARVSPSSSTLRSTRSQTAGVIPNPLPLSAGTLAYHGVTLWNTCPELRAAATRREAKRAAYNLGKEVPV